MQTPLNIADKLWSALEDKKVGMLGIHAGRRHFQPMTAHAERETQTLWFFTYADTELALSIGEGSEGMFCLESKDRQLYACIAGRMYMEHDPRRIEKYWSLITAAWFPKGKGDPRLTLIRFDIEDAEVWTTDKGRAGFLYEIVKANITHAPPNVGGHGKVHFSP